MTVEWSVSRGEMSVINTALQSLMVTTRAAPGCLACSLSTQLGERAVFRYEEDWRTEDDLNHQLRSNQFAKLAHLLESALERPRIEFTLPEGKRGMEYAEQVRRQPGEAPQG
jgi:quinol monooxygenase YgiN